MANDVKTISDQPLTSRTRRKRTAHIDYVSWLSDDILLLTGRFHASEGHPVEACLVHDDQVIPLEVRYISYPLKKARAGSGADLGDGKVLTARLLRRGTRTEDFGELLLKIGTSSFNTGQLIFSRVVELRTLLKGKLNLQEWQKPEQVLEFLTTTLRDHLGTTNIVRLNESLTIIHEALRPRFPVCHVTMEQPRSFSIENLLAINETSFYIRGWISDPNEQIEKLTFISPEGRHAEVSKKAFYFDRPDIQLFFNTPAGARGLTKNGVLSYFTIDSPSVASTGWLAQMKNAAGDVLETTVAAVTRNYATIKDLILSDFATHNTEESLLLDHVFPALSQLQIARQHQVEVLSVEQFGCPQASTDVSIIVPLYSRIDFLEQQLAQFVHDPQIRDVDLIYVLDSPELADTISELAPHLFELYQVPFRLAILRENYGYAAANNVGAAMAKGRLLVLLNSDVLPKKPGWLGTMVSFYDALPDIGALGPKLLFEDETLQHAGLFFECSGNSTLWTNQHYFKGYESDLPAANQARPVPGVTGACMMVATALYETLGGLSATYVQGDYEDSDFCLRLIESGRKNWYLPQVELYHLEGQSYPGALRQMARKFNTWVQTKLWRDLIEEVMSEYPGRFEVTASDRVAMAADSVGVRRQPKNLTSRTDLASPGLIRTTRSDLIRLYLQTCARRCAANDHAGAGVWVLSELHSVIAHACPRSRADTGLELNGYRKSPVVLTLTASAGRIPPALTTTR